MSWLHERMQVMIIWVAVETESRARVATFYNERDAHWFADNCPYYDDELTIESQGTTS